MYESVVRATMVVAVVGCVPVPQPVELATSLGAGFPDNLFVIPGRGIVRMVPVVARLRIGVAKILADEGVEFGLALGYPHHSARPVIAKYRSELYASTLPRFLFGALP